MVVTDLTEQKRNEAILAAEKLARAILEQAADAIVICDETGRIMRASNQAQALYGNNPLGQLFEQAFPLRQLDGTAFSAIGAIDTTRSQSVEARLEHNGQEFDLLVSVGHLKGARDELLGSVVTLTDITERKEAEVALQKKEMQLSEALTIARIGYWEYEYPTDEFIFNDQYYLLHKITAEEAGGYRMSPAYFASRYVYPEDAPDIGQHVRWALETRDPDYFAKTQVRILSGEGDIIWVEVSFRIEKDLQGNTIRLIGVNQNITEHKLAENEIRSISQFASENPSPVLRIERNGTIVYANHSAAPILTTWGIDVGQKVSNDWQKSITQSFESGINNAVEIGCDGRIFSCILTPILAEGYVNIYGRDITESKKAEEHLKLFRTLLDNSSDAIEVLDPVTMRFLDVNETECRELGYSLEEMLSMRNTDIDPLFNTGLNNETLAQIRQTGEVRFESVHRRKDGSKFPVEISAKLVEIDKLYLLSIVRNITERKQAELKLHESERRFSDLLGNVELISMMLDREARITYCNEYLMYLTGWKFEEVIGKSWWELFVPPEIQDLRNAFFTSLLDNQPEALHHENDIVTRSGERRLIRWSNTVLRSDDGEVIGTASIGEDITDRKLAEENLRWRTAFFESLVKTSVDGILVVDSQGNKILQNQRMIDLWKIPEDFAANPDDKPQLQYVIDQVVDANQFGDKVRYLYEHPKETSQDEVALKNGIFLDRYSAPVLDSDGHYYGRIWSFRDITERKQAELILRTSEDRFRTIFLQSPLGIALIDSLNRRIHEVNTRFAEIAGRSLEEMRNIDWVQITHPDDAQAELKAIALMNARKITGFRMEKRYFHPDGTAVWIDMTVTPLKVGHQTRPFHLCMIQDITERKQSEANIKYLNRVLSVLSGINALIVRVNDREELFRGACDIAVDAGWFRMAMLVIVDPVTMQPVSITSAGKNEALLADIKNVMSSAEGMQKSLVALTIREKEAVIANDTQNDTRLLFGKQYSEAGVKSMTVLPLIISGEAVGALALYASEIEFFQKDEMKLLAELAGDIAYAIDHLNKQERLNYLAYYDLLTGLANRNLFFERVAQYKRSAVSGGHKLAMFLIDLERFKNINDSLGRPAGDALLKQVAEWLTRSAGDATPAGENG